jgi:WD40 repeat protein
VRLVTTRLPSVLNAVRYTEVLIDEMRAAEAARLIAMNLPVAAEPGAPARLGGVAVRLGNWAQMLAIANGWLRDRVEKRERLADAIARFERRLAKDGPFVFDPKDETQRNRAIRLCIAASVEDLDAAEAIRFGELAILPEDEDVPLSVIEALWAETGEVDEEGTDDLVRRLDALSLLQSLDLGARTLRLHDNIIWYLRDKVGAEGCRAAHAAMVRAIGARCNGGHWETLRPADIYGWRYLIRHLRGAGRDEEADGILTSYAWIKAKLRASRARGLFDSYLPESQDEGVRLVGRAIALSLPALTANPHELPRQLFGRLGDLADKTVTGLVASAQQDPDFRPAPRWPGLTPPGAERLRLVGHQGLVWSASFSPDGARIVTASGDGTARIWDAATGQEIIALRGHESDNENGVWSASFSPDGARTVTGGSDSTARIWDAATGQEILALRGHGRIVFSASFSPDGARIVTGDSDGTARIWDAATGKEILALRGHEGVVSSASFSPDGARIVTASGDGTARIWHAVTGRKLLALRGHENGVLSASFSPDGARIVTASGDGTARIWDAATGKEIIALRGHESDDESAVGGASFSLDGARIITASDDRTARIWDAATGREILALRGHEGPVLGASFSPDGARIVTASGDGTARIWDAATAQEILALRGHTGSVSSASFSPDGARIITISHDFENAARIWDATTGKEILALRHEKWVRNGSFSPDGARIVTASDDRTARVWDAATGREILALRGHEDTVWSASFSPDGASIVTASGDCTARIWDAATAQEILALRGHEEWVMSASFSPDEARIVTASDDHTARIWDATTGQEILALRGHEDWVWSAAFFPDGARIVTASKDRTARIWDAATGQEITRIVLDASVAGPSVYRGTIALGDGLGRLHVFEAEDFLSAKSSVSD